MTRVSTAALLLVLAALAGCARAPSPAEIAARAATLRPADARLASLYEHSCRACHAQARASAPLAGDRAAWRPRLAKSMPELLQSIVAGYNGMPAGGQCFTCTPQDYEALVRFMADETGR
jgi:cytochrome c5